MLTEIVHDTDNEKAQKNYNKIIRTIAKEVLVDK
jgi:hypothetical protein